MLGLLIKLYVVRGYSAEELKWALWVYQEVDIKVKLQKTVKSDDSDWRHLLRSSISRKSRKGRR